MPSPLDRLRQKSRKWMVTLFGGLLLLMVGLGLTANPLFFVGVVILAGYAFYGITKEVRCPFCGLFDPAGMWRLELEDLFKRRSVCPQCRRDLKIT